MQRNLIAWSVLILSLTIAGCETQQSPTEPVPSGRTGYGVLPSGVVVDSAHLMVHVRQAAGLMIVVHPQTAAWDEHSVTWNAIGIGLSPFVMGTFNVADTGWHAVDVSGLVHLWLAGTWENNGVILDQNAPEYFRNAIDSREMGRLAPRLRIFSVDGTGLPQDYYAVGDAYIRADHPDLNTGSDDVLFSGWTDTEPGERRTLIRFDLTTPPPVPYSSIGDRVWDDTNMNGVQDEGEVGVADVVVNLRDCDEVLLESTTTDADGLYLFDSLDAGIYVVQFVAPSGYGFTDPLQGGDPTLDSDADRVTGFTFCIDLPQDVDDDSCDAGLYLLPPDPDAVLGDRVWNDVNMNGLQDPDEPGMAGSVVELLGCDGSVLAQTTTDADGMYRFEALEAGSYQLQFRTPEGWQFSPDRVGSDPELDSDAQPDHGRTECIVLGQSVSDDSRDAGMFETPPDPSAVLGNRVWNDVNMNGVQDPDEPGMAGSVVELLGCDGSVLAQTTTDADGMYYFEALEAGLYALQFRTPEGWQFSPDRVGSDPELDSDAQPENGRTVCIELGDQAEDGSWDAGMYQTPPDPSAVLGDRVWNDVNMNGVQDPGEPGMAGSVVELLGCDGSVLAQTTTDADGMYYFEALEAGLYALQFHTPEGWQFSPLQGTTDTELDSDAHPDNGRTVCIELGDQAEDGSWDAGMFETPPDPVSAVGDFVWHDLDADGIQDAGEPGLAGVTVVLLDCQDLVLAQTQTDADGHYGFEELTPGAFRIKFVAPSDWLFSPKRAGEHPELDSDAHPESGRTPCFDLPGDVEDPTWDAGLFEPVIEPSIGCTRIRWWWKHHAGADGDPDSVSQYLPIWLGVPGGPKSVLVETADQAHDIMSFRNRANRFNGVTRLSSELLTTKLNWAAGATPEAIAEVEEMADAFLALNCEDDWSSMDKDTRMMVWTAWFYMKLYNWGVTGPGMCDYECDYVSAAADDEDWYADDEK